jgi:DNA-binding transcriptional regulator YiaG
VEAWEAGKSMPSGVATRMLYLIEADHSLVDKLVVR